MNALAMAELRRRFKQPPADYSCHIPVFGVDVEGLPSSTGGVLLVLMNAARMRQLAFPDGVELAGEAMSGRQWILTTLKDDQLLGHPMAVAKVRARDANAAQYLAHRKTKEAVDVLNFFADLIPNSPGWVYLAGEAASQGASGATADRARGQPPDGGRVRSAHAAVVAESHIGGNDVTRLGVTATGCVVETLLRTAAMWLTR